MGEGQDLESRYPFADPPSNDRPGGCEYVTTLYANAGESVLGETSSLVIFMPYGARELRGRPVTSLLYGAGSIPSLKTVPPVGQGYTFGGVEYGQGCFCRKKIRDPRIGCRVHLICRVLEMVRVLPNFMLSCREILMLHIFSCGILWERQLNDSESLSTRAHRLVL